MNLFNGNNEELTLNFTTKNYMQLKKLLKADDLRRALLEAASRADYEALAYGIKQFADSTAVKTIDDAYAAIDTCEDKTNLFYEFISELGEHGFFGKTMVEQLKAEAEQPYINMQELLNKVAPDVAKNYMTTGANTLQTSE
jgi:hypothetical protein